MKLLSNLIVLFYHHENERARVKVIMFPNQRFLLVKLLTINFRNLLNNLIVFLKRTGTCSGDQLILTNEYKWPTNESI